MNTDFVLWGSWVKRIYVFVAFELNKADRIKRFAYVWFQDFALWNFIPKILAVGAHKKIILRVLSGLFRRSF